MTHGGPNSYEQLQELARKIQEGEEARRMLEAIRTSKNSAQMSNSGESSGQFQTSQVNNTVSPRPYYMQQQQSVPAPVMNNTSSTLRNSFPIMPPGTQQHNLSSPFPQAPTTKPVRGESVANPYSPYTQGNSAQYSNWLAYLQQWSSSTASHQSQGQVVPLPTAHQHHAKAPPKRTQSQSTAQSTVEASSHQGHRGTQPGLVPPLNNQGTRYSQISNASQVNEVPQNFTPLVVSKPDQGMSNIRVIARAQAEVLKGVIARWSATSPNHSFFPIDGSPLRVCKDQKGSISIARVRPTDQKYEFFAERDLPLLLEQVLQSVQGNPSQSNGQTSTQPEQTPTQTLTKQLTAQHVPTPRQALPPAQASTYSQSANATPPTVARFQPTASVAHTPQQPQQLVPTQPQHQSHPPKPAPLPSTSYQRAPTQAQPAPASSTGAATARAPTHAPLSHQTQTGHAQPNAVSTDMLPQQQRDQLAPSQLGMIDIPHVYTPAYIPYALQQQMQITNTSVPLPPARTAQPPPAQSKAPAQTTTPRLSSPLSKTSVASNASSRTAAQADKKHLARDILRALGKPTVPAQTNGTPTNPDTSSAQVPTEPVTSPPPPTHRGNEEKDTPSHDMRIGDTDYTAQQRTAPCLDPMHNSTREGSSGSGDIRQTTAFKAAVSNAVANISAKLTKPSGRNTPTSAPTNGRVSPALAPTRVGDVSEKVDGVPNWDMMTQHNQTLIPTAFFPATNQPSSAEIGILDAMMADVQMQSHVAGSSSVSASTGKARQASAALVHAGSVSSSGKVGGSNRKMTRNQTENRAFVLVPPLPDYLRKIRRRQRGQSEGGSSRGPPSDNFDLMGLSEELPASDEEEALLLKLVKTRFNRRECKWNGCNAVLNSCGNLLTHLQQHCPSNGSMAIVLCSWQQCGRFFSRSSQLLDHVSVHALSPLPCPYEGCDQSFRTSQQLVRHARSQHEKCSATKSGALPFPPTAPQLTRLSSYPNPKILPAYMVESRPVLQPPISEERHATLGPWVLRNIAGPVTLGNKRYNAAVPLRAAMSADGRGAGVVMRRVDHSPYEYMLISSTRFSTMPSQPAKLRNMPELSSGEVSELFSEGLVLWPPSETENERQGGFGVGTENLVTIGDGEMAREQNAPLAVEGFDGSHTDGAAHKFDTLLGQLGRDGEAVNASGDESETVEMMLTGHDRA